MRKLERLSQQIGNIVDADERVIRGLQRVTSLLLHDTKLEMISKRAALDISSKSNSSVASSKVLKKIRSFKNLFLKSSPLNSPFSSVPSTPAHSSSPIRTASPEPPKSHAPARRPSGPDPFRIPKTENPPPPNPNPFEDENDNYDDELNPFFATTNDSSSNVSEKSASDRIQMSPRIENVFQVEKDEKDVQIEFLVKDIGI